MAFFLMAKAPPKELKQWAIHHAKGENYGRLFEFFAWMTTKTAQTQPRYY
jgi:hypothetical protein